MSSAGSFQEAIRAAGLNPPDVIEPGKFYRIPGIGKRNGNTAGWCKQFPDGAGGVFGDFASGFSEGWQAKRKQPMSDAERREWQQRIELEQREAESESEREHAEARKRAEAIFSQAAPATNDHPYLARKGVEAYGVTLPSGKYHGLKVYRGDLVIAGVPCDGSLIVPLTDAQGVLWTLQFIVPGGKKLFLAGGRKEAGYFGIGTAPKEGQSLCIAEGYATASSIHAATGYPVVVAFDAGNLRTVATELRKKYPQIQIIVCADNDIVAGKANVGLAKAREAARAIGGLIAIPELDGAKCDFNDLAQAMGAEAVKRAVEGARAADSATGSTHSESADGGAEAAHDWPEPLPLIAKANAEPYPLDALPNSIRMAVEEVQGFTKAPIPLVASSALAALSLAIQGHADIKRAEKLAGPVSLYLLTIADSGERKSTCDGFFTAAIREYDQQQAEAAKPDVARHMADLEAWTAKREGIKAKIRDVSKRGKEPTESHEAALRDLEERKPHPPRVPKLLRGDDTPENLAFVMAREWPAAGVASSEAGAILGAHGMGKDSIMRNLALLNILWENGSLQIGRRTSESFTLRGARLTVALQVQEATLRSFFDRSQGLARGSGFLARFLIAWPDSTQGSRQFTEAPSLWPALAAFNRSITEILGQSVPVGADGALSPAALSLAPDAKTAWVAFHDAIEGELRTGGDLYDVRDVASKTADNAARIAALFQIFEHGMGGAVGPECLEGASRIAAWHLNESRRFFGDLALPVEVANAARLDAWLVDYCRRGRTHIVPRREVQRCGPNGLREKAALTEALRELADAGRIREVHEARRKDILVNPALLTGAA